MSDLKSEIIFEGTGLNWDDSQRVMNAGDAPYKLNILMGEDYSQGEVTNMQGNSVVTYNLFAEGCNTHFVLGSHYDQLNRCVYYWVFSQPYDTTGSGDYEYDNRLLRYNEDTNTIDTIFIDTKNYFGLHPNYLMKDPFIIGSWLYFNPRVSEPRMIDVVMAYNYTNYDAYDEYRTYVLGDKCTYFGGLFLANQAVGLGETPVSDQDKWDRIGDSYQNFTGINEDSEFRYAFNVLKMPPVTRPVCVYDSDTTFTSNNVRGIIGRFSYRYKYFDGTHSRYSAFSDVTLPDYDEYYNGEVPNDITYKNFINVVLPLHSAALVDEIEVVYQVVGEDWKRVKVINRKDIELLAEQTYFYRFYNNETYPSVPNEDVGVPYDAVPRTAECQEVINKNILCYGHCKEGFDNIDKNDIAVTLLPVLQDISISEDVDVVLRDNIAERDFRMREGTPYEALPVWSFYLFIDNWYAGAALQAGDIYILNINEVNVEYTIQAADVAAGAINFAIALAAQLKVLYPTMEFSALTDPSNGYFVIAMYSETSGGLTSIGKSLFYRPSGAPTSSLTKYRDFKSGAHHPFCLYYYDGSLRRWDAQVSKTSVNAGIPNMVDGTTVYVPMLNEYAPLPVDTANKWVIDWEINHTPPEGAKYWRWGYAGNSLCSWFVQYVISSIAASAPGAGEPANTIKIDITPLQEIATTTNGAWNQLPQSNISPYEWQRGDRVRFITEDIDSGNMGAIIDGMYDYEILKFDSDNNLIFITDEFNFAAVVGGTGDRALIEIYRPRKADSQIEYYEFGPLYPVIKDINGLLLHGGQSQDQDLLLSLPATGRFEYGDIYRIIRTPSYPISTIVGYFHESLWYSDFYDSDDYDRGKVGYELNFGERYLNIIRYSNQYLQDTEINGLSTFDGNNYKELNDVYGKLLRIIEIGDTLKFYQRKKPGSIMIGRTEYVDAEGNANIVQTSTRVLGAIRYSGTNYGTEFPESISRNNRYVYGFDVYNGVFWRDSANGIFPISGKYTGSEGAGDYKMDSYFKQKAKALLTSGVGYCDVMTVWDERYKNLFVTFRDLVNDDNDETIVFHEPSNRWICFTEFDQTPIGGWNQMLELTYEVIQGFDAGIGFYFDEDTRFAVFDIGLGLGTTDNYSRNPGTSALTYAAPNPTVQVDNEVTGLTAALTYSAPDPSAVHTYVTLSETLMEWDQLFGQSSRQELIVYSGDSVAKLTSQPDWIRLTINDTIINPGDEVPNGTSVWVYPPDINGGSGELSGSIVFTDAIGNTDSVTVTQQMYEDTSPPIFYVIVPVANVWTDAGLSVVLENPATAPNVVGSAGSDSIAIDFYVDGLAESSYTANVDIFVDYMLVYSDTIILYEGGHVSTSYTIPDELDYGQIVNIVIGD